MTRRAFLTAEWRWLVMLNYEIDPAHLAPFLPRGTTLDLWQDRAMVSVVGFQFLNSAIAGLPLPFHQRFEEVNLRFYVRREAAGEVRRGVTFIRELVPHTVVALAARVAYNEPYTAVPMRSVVPPAVASEGRVEYAWKVRASWQHIAAEFHGAAEVPAADSEAIVHRRALLGLWQGARRLDARIRGLSPALAHLDRQQPRVQWRCRRALWPRLRRGPLGAARLVVRG